MEWTVLLIINQILDLWCIKSMPLFEWCITVKQERTLINLRLSRYRLLPAWQTMTAKELSCMVFGQLTQSFASLRTNIMFCSNNKQHVTVSV